MSTLPDRKYRIIYADPPWEYGSRYRSRGNKQRVLKYRTMSTPEICELPVGDISLPNSVLFLWTTDAHLEQALQVMNAWGFKYKTVAFVWSKRYRSGKFAVHPGNWTMKNSELCLLGSRGQAHAFLVSYKVRQLTEEPPRTHSQKPDEIRRRIVQMFGDAGPRIELFARERYDDWDAWGDEVN